tara:strand:+ start:522 stop:722 length:201 start_codon:yes stop_codon:yes gene_type:complete
MNWKEIEEKRNNDIHYCRNSLSWIKPIAENVLMHMSSDELYEFIEKTLVAKQMKLAEKLLNPKEDE